MTVADLISRLGDFDPNLMVVMPSEHGDWCEVDSAFDEIVWFSGTTVQLSDERSPADNVAVVRLFGPDDD
jgi:hypothetical protein